MARARSVCSRSHAGVTVYADGRTHLQHHSPHARWRAAQVAATRASRRTEQAADRPAQEACRWAARGDALKQETKQFTLLHSNDMHGDFLAEVAGQGRHLIGGLSLLSGYINKVRQTEKNVIFVISGDMVQGSLIDSEYKGISTMEIMNYLAPDVVTLGNHELDYGLPHLLFLEKMAISPSSTPTSTSKNTISA